MKLAKAMWCVIAGFVKDHHMEAAASCGKDPCGSSACWAWVPLEHKEAVLVVHDTQRHIETHTDRHTHTQQDANTNTTQTYTNAN